MMIIADEDQESDAFLLIQDVLGKVPYKTFIGSDFRDDSTEDAAYRLINDIILCMERGISCVLANLSIVYQSFYDMLNQNYSLINGQNWCKIAIGADSTRCFVHEDFRCIVVVTSKDVKKLDPPLLNRFEKQKFHKATSEETNSQVKSLNDWLNSMVKAHQRLGFNDSDLFPVKVEGGLGNLVAQFN